MFGKMGKWGKEERVVSGTVLTGTVKSYSAKGFGFILCRRLSRAKHEIDFQFGH